MEISGSNNRNVGNHKETTNNYNGLKIEDLVKMIEERFRHLVRKDDQIEQIFEENRKLTDEVIRQNQDFREYNHAYRRLVEEIVTLKKELSNK